MQRDQADPCGFLTFPSATISLAELVGEGGFTERGFIPLVLTDLES